jgi:hypothetical protein
VESLRQRAEGVFERMDRLYQMIAVQIAN